MAYFGKKIKKNNLFKKYIFENTGHLKVVVVNDFSAPQWAEQRQ